MGGFYFEFRCLGFGIGGLGYEMDGFGFYFEFGGFGFEFGGLCLGFEFGVLGFGCLVLDGLGRFRFVWVVFILNLGV